MDGETKARGGVGGRSQEEAVLLLACWLRLIPERIQAEGLPLTPAVMRAATDELERRGLMTWHAERPHVRLTEQGRRLLRPFWASLADLS